MSVRCMTYLEIYTSFVLHGQTVLKSDRLIQCLLTSFITVLRD